MALLTLRNKKSILVTSGKHVEIPKINHFNILDILRGISASLVCLFHFTNGHLPKLTNNITQPIFKDGNLGVYVFFVISGFIIPYALTRSKYVVSKKGFWKFIIKRMVRIFPPSFLALLFLVFLWQFIDIIFKPEILYMESFTIKGFLANVFYVAPFLGYKWYNGVFWTLAVEFQFYLFIGLLFSLLFKNKWYLIVSSLVFCLFIFSLPSKYPFIDFPVYSAVYFTFYSFFAIGFFTLMIKNNRISPGEYFLFLLLFSIIIFYLFDYIAAISAVITSLLIVYFNFRNKALEFLGTISYSLYLTHMVSGIIFEGLITKLILIDGTVLKIAMQIGAFLFSLLGAFLFYIFIEKPFIHLSNRIFK